jgi:two-component system sensor histidine kinase VicK
MKRINTLTEPLNKTTPENTADMNGNAVESFGTWQFNLQTSQLSLSPPARSLLGVSQGGNYQINELFRLIDPACLDKAKAWLRTAGDSGVLEQICLKVLSGKEYGRWIRITGFHYAERWERPNKIIGVFEDYTQNVDEERIALAIVNHELRTPLSVMKLKAQMIQKTGNPFTPVTHADMARSIETQVESITRMLDQYLSGSAVNTAPLVRNATVFDLNKLTAQIINDIKYLYAGHRFIHSGVEHALVNADKYQIMQVLINYLTNAAKYSPARSEIRTEISIDQQQVLVKVTDHGCGIKAGLEKRVFDRFYRAGNAGVEEPGSKGLGLYLVRQIIELHNGRVWAKRGLEDGTEFYFQLPRSGSSPVRSLSRKSFNALNGEELILVKRTG